MFKPGEVIVCVDVLPHKYSEYWDTINSWSNIKKGPKTITIGKRYDVINCTKHDVTIINDNGYQKSYRADRFVSLSKDRKSKIKKLKKRIIKCSK